MNQEIGTYLLATVRRRACGFIFSLVICHQGKGMVEKGLCHRREIYFLDAQNNP